MMVFGTHCNFFIFLPIGLKTCRSNVFFFFTRQNISTRKIGRLRGFTRPSAPERHRARSLSRPDSHRTKTVPRGLSELLI